MEGFNTQLKINRDARSGLAWIPVIIITAIVLLLVFGVAWGIAFAEKKNRTGEEPNYSGIMDCPSGNYSVVAKSPAIIKLINQNIDFFKEVADKTNVPWQVIASVSYRESNLDTSRSLSNGEAYCNNIDNTYNKPCNGKMDDAVGAMEHLKGKSPGGWNKNNFDAEKIKKALFGYNGVAEAYKDQAVKMGFPRDPGYDGSPYVMNNFDAKHRHMGIISHNGGGIDANDARDGAFTVASLLVNGEYGDDGKIVSLGGCKYNPGGMGSSLITSILAQELNNFSQSDPNYRKGENRVKYNNFNGDYWCAWFAIWVYKKAGYQMPSQPLSRALYTWFKNNGHKTFEDPKQAQPGDIMIFRKIGSDTAGHTAVVYQNTGSSIVTIEGNCGRGDSDKVCKRERSFISLNDNRDGDESGGSLALVGFARY